MSGTHFAVSVGFRRRVRRGGVLVGVPERACGGVFTDLSGGTRCAHPYRSSVGLVAHRPGTYRTARTSLPFVCRPYPS